MLDLAAMRLTATERNRHHGRDSLIADAQLRKALFGVLHWLEHDTNPTEWTYSISQKYSVPSLDDGGRRYVGRALREAVVLGGIKEDSDATAD